MIIRGAIQRNRLRTAITSLVGEEDASLTLLRIKLRTGKQAFIAPLALSLSNGLALFILACTKHSRSNEVEGSLSKGLGRGNKYDYDVMKMCLL
jgi:hypothetical protein